MYARVAATALVERDPQLEELPALRAQVAQLSDDDRSDYLEKG